MTYGHSMLPNLILDYIIRFPSHIRARIRIQTAPSLSVTAAHTHSHTTLSRDSGTAGQGKEQSSLQSKSVASASACVQLGGAHARDVHLTELERRLLEEAVRLQVGGLRVTAVDGHLQRTSKKKRLKTRHVVVLGGRALATQARRDCSPVEGGGGSPRTCVLWASVQSSLRQS